MLKERALVLCVLCLAAILLVCGLRARSISRSEGRWAVIAREMIDSGDYLTPTINKIPYYDKPLLSYWAILPFAAIEGKVSEWSARMPSALAALATVFLIYLMGKKLFGRAEGLAAAALLATAAMFVSLGRTASADPLNMLAVWGVLWCFISGGAEGRPGWTTALYLTAAAGSFLKGPVAGAAAFAVILIYSAAGVVLRLRKDSFSGPNLRKVLKAESRWIFSRGGVLGIAAGTALFAALLFGPFLLSGDSGLMRLMWKENVVRFLEPFDHKDPVYSYLVYGALYFAPWTLLFLAALFDAKAWPAGKGRRFALLSAAGIFLFFTASGSRRSYYILPLVPAMSLIAGNTLVRWSRGACARGCRFVKPALWFAVLCALAAPPVLVYLRFHPEILPQPAGWIFAAVAVAAAALAAAKLLLAGRRTAALAALGTAVFIAELFAFTAVTAAAEETRTLRPFCVAAAHLLKGVPTQNIALYRVNKSALVFHLERSGLPSLSNRREAESFAAKHPGGFLIGEALPGTAVFKKDKDKDLPPLGEKVLEQKPQGTKAPKSLFALLKIPARAGPAGDRDAGDHKNHDRDKE